MTIYNIFNSIKENDNNVVAEKIVFKENGTKIHSIKSNQDYIFKKYRGEQYFIMNEPSGSGKSATLEFIMADRLIKLPDHKVVICVPLTTTSKTFGHVILEYSDGTQIEWNIGNNLCEDTNGSKVDILTAFLKEKNLGEDINNRVIITTHITLARVVRNGSRLFENTSIVIDEAHHILYPENGNTSSCNKIGGMINKIIERNNSDTSIWLSTATFFRGDRGSILSQDIIDSFTYHFLPFDEHWKKNIKHIKTFEFNFAIYKEGEVFEYVKQILKNKNKSIIICPYIGKLLTGIDKFIFRDRLIDAIREDWPDCNILDLIEDSGRKERKKLLFDIDTANEIDVILSLKLFDESSDWPPAAFVIDLVHSNSLRIMSQRIGREWRDFVGKSHVKYFAFLPYYAKFDNEEDRRKHLSNNYNALTATLLLREAIAPVPYPKFKEKSGETKYETNPFEEEVPDESRRQTILNKVIKNVLFLRNSNENPTSEEVRTVIKDTLSDFGISEDKVDDVTVHIAKILRRSSFIEDRKPKWENEQIDVSWMREAGFDKIWRNDIFDNLLSFGTGVCDIKTFKEFREVYGENKTVEEWVKIAEDLEKIYETLPIDYWLHNNGYEGLTICKRKNSEKFAHIIQDRNERVTPPEERDKEVFEVVEKNNGFIPTYSEFVDMNKKSLYRYIYLNYEKFKHIKLSKPKNMFIKTDKEKRDFAESIAFKNGGVLPTQVNLAKDPNTKALAEYIRKEPNIFKYMMQYWEKTYNIRIIGTDIIFSSKEGNVKLAKERRKYAESLTDEKNILPKGGHLIENGNSVIVSDIRNHPERYKGMKQYFGKHGRVIIIGEDNSARSLADKVAKENGGILPKSQHLRENNLRIIATDIRNHPERYKGMKQYYGKGNKIRTLGKDDDPELRN